MPNVAEIFEAGFFTQVTWKWDMPDHFGDTAVWFEISFNMAVSAAYSGMEATEISLLERVQADRTLPPAYVEWKSTLDSTDPIDVLSTKAVRGRFAIPNGEIIGKESGLLVASFSVASTSTGPDLYIGDVRGTLRFGPQSPVNGFSFV